MLALATLGVKTESLAAVPSSTTSDLEIRPGLVIPGRELRFSYSRSSGPGGQNVQKVETRVQLRFALMTSEVLGDKQKARIAALAGRRMTAEGELIMACEIYRERERNRVELRARLRRLILQALRPRKKRVATKPTRASRERRLQEKQRRSHRKQERRRPQVE